MHYDTNDEIATALRNLMYASQMIILKTPRNDVNRGLAMTVTWSLAISQLRSRYNRNA